MIQGPQLIIVLAIVLLLFGGSKLPKLARSLGEAQKEFRDGLKESEKAQAVTKVDTANVDGSAGSVTAEGGTGTAPAEPTRETPPAG